MYNPDEFFKAERHTGFLNPPSSYKNVVTVEGNCVDAHCTNADRIRAMSDEELAEYLSTMQAHAYYHGMYHGKMSDEAEWQDWLQQEATE